MTVCRYEKITVERRTEPARETRIYDKLYKVQEVIVMVKNKYSLNRNLAIDEAMILWTGTLS